MRRELRSNKLHEHAQYSRFSRIRRVMSLRTADGEF